MYLLTELILLSPLILYAYVRTRALLSGRARKIACSVFFCLVLLGYPLAEALSHRTSGSWVRFPLLAGYFCLPYLLYLILAVPFFDLAAAALRYRRQFRFPPAVRLVTYLLIPAVIVVAGHMNNSRLLVKTYSFELARKSSNLNALTIAFASDFHLGVMTENDLIERFVTKVNALSPDIILIGGDVLEGDREDDLGKFSSQLRLLRSRYGVFAAPGNHEHRGGPAGDFFRSSGITLLEDRVISIEDGFYLAGRQDGRATNRKPVSELLQPATKDLPIILIDHRPTEIDQVSRSRVDLQLSGHTHNGQLFPVNVIVMPFQYDLAWGSMVRGNTWFVVTSGTQAWGPPVRTAGDSEMVFIKATFRNRSLPGRATHD
jgi:uncharacterized protein